MDMLRLVIGVFAISTTTQAAIPENRKQDTKCLFSGHTNVVLYKYPPFLLDTSNVSIDLLESGHILGVKSKKVLKCLLRPCHGAKDLTWEIRNATNRQELFAKLFDDKVAFVYPIPLDVYNDYSDSRAKFIPVQGSKTQARFVNIENCRTDLSHVIFTMIYKQWPIFTLMILLAGIAGIIVWLLESRDSNEEFAKSFFQGGFDGFWWAFISMTTVGYGDKTPRSLIGRLFSILWIFLGITIVSFFTATITSAITIATVKNSCEQIENRTVAVLRLQPNVKSYVEDNSGEAKEYNLSNVIQMFDDLNNEKNKIDSMLIDVALANQYTHDLTKRKNIKKVKAVEIPKTEIMFYVLVRSNNSTPACFSDEYHLDKVPMPHDNNNRVQYAVLEEEVVQPLSLESPETWPFMYTLVVGLVGMIVLGTVQDMLKRIRRRHRSKTLNDGSTETCLEVVASSSSESSAVIYQTRHAVGVLGKEMKEMKVLMNKTIERLAAIEKLVESSNKQEQ